MTKRAKELLHVVREVLQLVAHVGFALARGDSHVHDGGSDAGCQGFHGLVE